MLTLQDITVTSLGKGMFRAECAMPPDPEPGEDLGLPTTRAELVELIKRVQAGELAVEPVTHPKDLLFGEMYQALRSEGSPYQGREQYDDFHNGDEANVLFFYSADDREGGAELKGALTPEEEEAVRKNAPGYVHARVGVTRDAGVVGAVAVARGGRNR